MKNIFNYKLLIILLLFTGILLAGYFYVESEKHSFDVRNSGMSFISSSQKRSTYEKHESHLNLIRTVFGVSAVVVLVGGLGVLLSKNK